MRYIKIMNVFRHMRLVFCLLKKHANKPNFVNEMYVPDF